MNMMRSPHSAFHTVTLLVSLESQLNRIDEFAVELHNIKQTIMRMYRDLLNREQGRRGGSDRPLEASQILIQRLKHTGSLGDNTYASVSTATWSSDGSLMLSGGEDGVLRIWDVNSSRRSPSHSFDSGGHVQSLHRSASCMTDAMFDVSMQATRLRYSAPSKF
jgi:hypothetical protein